MNLRTPGPIPVPDDILEALSGPMINHRGPEFKDLLYRTTDRLKRVFETQNDTYIITASGTGAMEAAIANTLSPGDKVLCATVGVFGNRFAQIAEVYGADVIRLEFPLGTAIDVDKLRDALKDAPDIKAVLMTHNETSTGVTNDLEAVSKVVKGGEFDMLLLVDGISSACSIPLYTDAWQCDVVVAGSQKGWMLPPGLAFITVSEKAWEAYAESRMPKFYFDIGAYKRYLETGQPPFTPAVSLMFALDLALDKILAEGMGSVFERHATIGQMTRNGLKKLGLSIFPDESIASNTVTAVNVPDGVDASKLLTLVREEHGVVIAGGQQSLSGKILRIGHMGYCTAEEIQETLDALAETLPKVGFEPS